jgi:hypothetical protein
MEYPVLVVLLKIKMMYILESMAQTIILLTAIQVRNLLLAISVTHRLIIYAIPSLFSLLTIPHSHGHKPGWSGMWEMGGDRRNPLHPLTRNVCDSFILNE